MGFMYITSLFLKLQCRIYSQFSEDEITLLNKGLKYKLHYKHKQWITNLALEAETAVNLLPPIDQEHIRYQVTKNIQELYLLTYSMQQSPS